MNFRTTLILLIVLIAVGLVILFTRDSGGTKTETAQESKLLNINSADVTRLAFSSDDGLQITMEKADGKWQLTEPVKAPAEESAVDSLVDAVTGLKSRGQVDTSGADAATTGLDQPHFKLEVITKDGKTTKIDVGSRSATGGSLYIRRDGQSQADVVPAALADALDKPLKDWRSAKLFTVASPEIKQIRVATTQGSIELQRLGDDWKVTQPTSMPADPSAASDWAMAVSNLRAEDFVGSTKPADQARRYGLDRPVMTIAFSTTAPSTQPAATQPSFTKIEFGQYDSVLKKDVYASVSSEPGIVKIAAATMDQFKKQPIELRDKRVLDIDPEKVTKITITTDKPATTQPTTREASHEVVELERNKQQVGTTTQPAAPAAQASAATQPATQEASATTGPSTAPTTMAATQPVEPPSKWKLASKGGADADDSKVQQLLSELHPLRADKFVEHVPLVQINPTYTLRVETTDAVHELRFTDPGNSQPVIASYDGLNFEVSRFVLEKMEGDFVKPPPGSTPPSMGMPPGMPPGMPMQMP